jgi:hypothetical protein
MTFWVMSFTAAMLAGVVICLILWSRQKTESPENNRRLREAQAARLEFVEKRLKDETYDALIGYSELLRETRPYAGPSPSNSEIDLINLYRSTSGQCPAKTESAELNGNRS